MRYTMTEEQHVKIMEACKPVPMIMLQCGDPPSAQDTANRAWKVLADELGFKWDTVRSVSGESDYTFDASPVEA